MGSVGIDTAFQRQPKDGQRVSAFGSQYALCVATPAGNGASLPRRTVLAVKRGYRFAACAVILLAACGNPPPSNDTASSGGTTPPSSDTVDSRDQPLLAEGHRGSHTWARYCEGRDSSAALPEDARKLVQPGVSDGRAVHFNAYWKECRSQVDPDYQDPQTCGEYRDWVAEGETLIKGNGAIGSGSIVGGSTADNGMAIDVENYNRMWRLWGLPGRPSNFDELVANRWGYALPDEPNPYPQPGEDPNQTNGGTGQLPMALTQLRQEDGTWTGQLGITCHTCHSARIGSKADGADLGAVYGTAGQGDLGAFLSDFGNGIGRLLPLTVNRIRGTGNVTNYQLLVMLWLIGDEGARRNIDLDSFVFAPATATEDSPVWWNIGHRPAKFYSGAMPSDATRITLQAYMPLIGENGYDWEEITRWTDAHDRQAEAWIGQLEAPAWPEGTLGAIDTELAEQGAILFHNRDLWGGGDNPVPRPEGGNGSCASCHGAYSPRYTHDPDFLATPELAGQAAFRVPNEIIGTDPAYTYATNQGVSDYFEYSWLFYPESTGEVGSCYGPNEAEAYRGYLAPPLYGVWATAPYFHNGSVPNVWEVLKAEDRKPIWRRVSAPSPSGQDVVTGFDTNLQRAYEPDKLGWRYEEVDCGSPGARRLLNCNNSEQVRSTIIQQLRAVIYRSIGLSWNLALPVMTDRQIENRKIYNTGEYSQSNEGHRFTDVLSDAERRALIEYLKTL